MLSGQGRNQCRFRPRTAVAPLGLAIALSIALQVPAAAADLTIPFGGQVTIELIGSDALYSNTLALVKATRPDGVNTTAGQMYEIVNGKREIITGCTDIEANNLTGVVPLLSGKRARVGCRITMDADDSTTEVDGFPGGTTLSFAMCAQTNPSPECEYIWYSDPGKNADRYDHVTTKRIIDTFQLGWEDTRDGGDRDFNDLVVLVRISNDRDGDGLWDDWETTGIDANGDGVIDLDLKTFDPDRPADPKRKDVFIQVDYMGCSDKSVNCATGHTHKPNQAALDDVIEAFKNAPVDNPDDVKGINLHIVLGNEIPHSDYLKLNSCGAVPAGALNFDDVKKDKFGDSNPRRFAFHYAIFAHRQDANDRGSSGCGELPGNDFLVTLGAWDKSVGTQKDQAGTFMHELGHNLGLRHGGQDHTNYKPNYISVMNYRYQTALTSYQVLVERHRANEPSRFEGAPVQNNVLDYSRTKLPDLDENNLDEGSEWNAAKRDEEFINVVETDGSRTAYERSEIYQTVVTCPAGGGSNLFLTRAKVDWNCDGRFTGIVKADVNRWPDYSSGVNYEVLNGYEDWPYIVYDFQNRKDYEDGVHQPVAQPEITVEEVRIQEQTLNRQPTALIKPVSGAVTAREIVLDGSTSSDPEGEPLSFEWRSVGRPAAIARANTATPIVQFFSGTGDYTFELTVTDAKSVTSTARITVTYLGR